jgi:hypothetical protein
VGIWSADVTLSNQLGPSPSRLIFAFLEMAARAVPSASWVATARSFQRLFKASSCLAFFSSVHVFVVLAVQKFFSPGLIAIQISFVSNLND